MYELVEQIKKQTAGLEPRELLAAVLERFGDRVALASSFGAEDQVLTDLLCGLTARPQVFTLDTGRLPEETYQLFEQTEARYGIRIEVLFPDADAVSRMVDEHGINLFRDSVENRKLCCRIRKVLPLQKRLSGLDAWICGLRKEQSVTRREMEPVEWDDQFGLIKINPLADWSTEQVWDYVERRQVPTHALHAKGYPSIGCAPCTRAVAPGEDIRSGRWWWEQPEHKECGLHWAALQAEKRS